MLLSARLNREHERSRNLPYDTRLREWRRRNLRAATNIEGAPGNNSSYIDLTLEDDQAATSALEGRPTLCDEALHGASWPVSPHLSHTDQEHGNNSQDIAPLSTTSTLATDELSSMTDTDERSQSMNAQIRASRQGNHARATIFHTHTMSQRDQHRIEQATSRDLGHASLLPFVDEESNLNEAEWYAPASPRLHSMSTQTSPWSTQISPSIAGPSRSSQCMTEALSLALHGSSTCSDGRQRETAGTVQKEDLISQPRSALTEHLLKTLSSLDLHWEHDAIDDAMKTLTIPHMAALVYLLQPSETGTYCNHQRLEPTYGQT